MRERRRIVELWRRGDAAVLVTLVRVEGSSYRRVGARMLIAASGEYAGAISGGCLEAEVARKAQWKVRAGAVVERYSTLFDDTAEIPYGLGCGGTVDLLFEPAGTDEFAALMEALAASLRDEARHVVTQLPECGRPLRRSIRDAEGVAIFESARTFEGAESFPAESEGSFEEWLEPPPRLFCFGAGDDAQPMVRMAALLGWSVTVVDGRAQWAKAERFAEAERVLVATSLETVQVGSGDAVVVMTHSYEQDRAWLAELLPRGPRYLGLLGARHRSALLASEVAALLGWSVERVCEGLFAPVGLDLGGDGAEAIALAVVAEIQACSEGKLGLSRRMTAESVAQQIAQGGASRYLQAQCAL
jgi:xanthine/CO dehydrogenase XdhC/CoxF family maturation factor